jgi:hypothetical protein
MYTEHQLHLHILIRGALFVLMALAGCSSTQQPGRPEADLEVKRQLELARSFESRSDLRRASHMYEMIAQTYPRSAATIEATRKAAILYGSVRNPGRNDSLAQYWFRKAVGLPISQDERDQAELCVSLLDRVRAHQQQARANALLADSLQLVIDRQWGTISYQSRRIQELEREIAAATEEMKKLKDVDVRLSQSRRRR